jgi:light-regulated signal transduction histidine kinase (bacteriophytochrome)
MLAEAFNAMLAEVELRTRALERSNEGFAREVVERAAAENEVSRLNEVLEDRVRERTEQLAVANRELEAFCYSVSHDLRAPLRAIHGFSQALRTDFPRDLSVDAQHYLDRIQGSAERMAQLIEDLLNLSRVSRSELVPRSVDLTEIAQQVVAALRSAEPGRFVEVSVWDGLIAAGDPRLLRTALENLVGNSWKFTAKTENPRIEVGAMRDGERRVYFVRDNGAGFDMAYAQQLFGAFQRLHRVEDFPGTGIGLATVARIVSRHGGRIWAEAQENRGAVFYFTLSREGVDGVAAGAESTQGARHDEPTDHARRGQSGR